MKNEDYDDANFLRAEDLIIDGVWSTITLTVKETYPPTALQNAAGKAIEKKVFAFVETSKKMVCNKINWRLTQFATGVCVREELPGHTITLYPGMGNWGNPKVLNATALRVLVPKDWPRPSIPAATLGKDITGRTFPAAVPVAKPAAAQVTKPQGAKPKPPAKPRLPEPYEAPPKTIREELDTPPPTPRPKPPSPGTQINACTTWDHLRSLMILWMEKRPLAKHKQDWADILPLVQIKLDKEGWDDSAAQALVGVIEQATNQKEGSG